MSRFFLIDSSSNNNQYCPPPVIVDNNSDGATVTVGDTFQTTIDGFNLDQVTSIVATSNGGNDAISGTILSQSFTQLVFTLTPNLEQDYTVAISGLCGDAAFQITSADILCLVPALSGSSVWQSLSANVDVSQGGSLTIVDGNGNGWNEGGQFGTAPANTAAELSWTVAEPTSNAFAFIGVRNSFSGISFGSAGRAIYFANGALNVYDNTEFQSSIAGGYQAGDKFAIRRDAAGTTTIHKNDGPPLFTFPTNDSGQWIGSISGFRNSSFEDIQLCF